MMLDRRHLLAGTAALAALAPARSFAQIEAALGRGFVNAIDFGLVPNDLAEGDDPAAYDQTHNMQRAVDAAAGAGLALLLPGGIYAVNSVTLPYSTTILGVRGATVLRSIASAPIFLGASASSITLRDLLLDGTGGGGNADHPGLLTLAECEELELDGLHAIGGVGSGLFLERCSGRIDNCVVRGFGDSGIFALDSKNLSITGNRVSACGNGGIRVWASEGSAHDGTLVAGNDVSDIASASGGNGQNGNGINVFQANGVTVANNRLRSCAFSAIRLNATNDTIVSGNTCLDSGEVAIFSEFGFSGSIIANNIVDGAAQGISMTNFDSGGRLAACTGNIVRNIAPSSRVNPDTTPVGIFAEADAVIADNIVENVPGLGIGAGWGPFLRDVAVTGNVVRDCDIGIGVSVAQGAGRAIVSANLVSGARRAGIAALAWTDVVSDDLVREAARFPQLSITGNSVG